MAGKARPDLPRRNRKRTLDASQGAQQAPRKWVADEYDTLMPVADLLARLQ